MGVVDIPLFYPVLCAVILFGLWTRTQTYRLRHIPTSGSSLPIFAYLEGLRWLTDGAKMIQEGYDKFASSGIFKIPMSDQWLVLISDPALIDELRKMPDDVANLRGAIFELFGGRDEQWHFEPLHAHLLYAKFSTNLGGTFEAIQDEIWHAFRTDIGSPEEWRSIQSSQVMTGILMKAINRAFVGLPLCRDQIFSGHVKAHLFRNFPKFLQVKKFPRWMRPLAARMLLSKSRALHAVHEYLAPIIQDRRRKLQEYKLAREEWHDKPNDTLMWLLEEVIQRGYPDQAVTWFLLGTETAAIHNTAASFLHALYYLAADPSLAAPLREEIDSALASEDGKWTRATLGKLVKLDSFLRESQRINGVNITTIWRVARQPFTFSNGVSIPAGTFLSAATSAYHTDEQRYKNPTVFDPWRFVDSARPSSFVTTNVEYIAFGHGRHACPGRHLAVAEMKLMMAYIVMTYDVAFQPGKTAMRPPNMLKGNMRIPNPNANIMFRVRK